MGAIQSQGKVHLIATLLGIYAFHSSAIATSCDEWFEKLNLKLGSVGCEADCTKAADKVAEANKESYCTPYCRGMCVPEKADAPCKLDSFWMKRLKASAEPFSHLASEDRRIVARALSRMPKAFRPAKMKAIVKASGEGGIITGYSPAVSSDEYLILFPSAFGKPGEIPRILAHELSHFLIENEWAHQFKEYKQANGWGTRTRRKGGFVESDGKSSAEEDFANNIEFYLFERSTLRTQSPEILGWIEKNMRALLQLEKECADAK